MVNGAFWARIIEKSNKTKMENLYIKTPFLSGEKGSLI